MGGSVLAGRLEDGDPSIIRRSVEPGKPVGRFPRKTDFAEVDPVRAGWGFHATSRMRRCGRFPTLRFRLMAEAGLEFDNISVMLLI
jgi:hypothetical protein